MALDEVLKSVFSGTSTEQRSKHQSGKNNGIYGSRRSIAVASGLRFFSINSERKLTETQGLVFLRKTSFRQPQWLEQ